MFLKIVWDLTRNVSYQTKAEISKLVKSVKSNRWTHIKQTYLLIFVARLSKSLAEIFLFVTSCRFFICYRPEILIFNNKDHYYVIKKGAFHLNSQRKIMFSQTNSIESHQSTWKQKKFFFKNNKDKWGWNF